MSSALFKLRLLATAGILIVPALLTAAALVACPDCGKQVSSRAIMCPMCGCPGQAIADAAREQLATVPEARPKIFDSVVLVGSERGSGWGTVVGEGGATYVVTSLEILGAESLELKNIWSNSPVAYASIELADDCNLVRLRTADTNLHALHWGTPELNGLVLIKESATNLLSLVPTKIDTGASTARIAGEILPLPGSPVLSSSTNVMAIISRIERGAASLVAASPFRQWNAIQPRDFRHHMKALIEAQHQSTSPATSALRRQAAQNLRSTSWPTHFLKNRSEALAKQLEQPP